jgi:hypothetical protein
MEQTVEQTHDYRPTWRNRGTVILWLYNTLLLGLLWWLAGFIPPLRSSSSHTIGGILFYAVWMGTFLTWMLYLYDVSLTIDPGGVLFTQGRLVVAGGWRDIERIDRRYWPATLLGEGLVLCEVRGLPRQWWRRMMVRHPGRFIPLARFDADWCEGPIGDDVRRYAPWLFSDASRGEPTP